MYLRPRHRRGSYPLAAEHTLPRGLRLLLAFGALVLVAYLVWTLFLRLLGLGSDATRAGAFLTVEERGTVNVMIDGSEQRAENGMMILPGETVSTGPGAHASLAFFDGSRVRLNDGSQITITDSARGTRDSRITLNLQQGGVFIASAGAKSFTGSIVWTIQSPTLGITVTPGTEAVFSPRSVVVFSSDSEGVTVSLAGHEDFVISEGQQWILPPDTTVGANVFDYRSPVDPSTAKSVFVTDSRALISTKPARPAVQGTGAVLSTSVLTVQNPVSGTVVKDPTLIVNGTVGDGVTRVLVNGYPAVLDLTKKTFTQEVSPPETEGSFDIGVQALDDARTILAEVHRIVQRAPAAPLSAPTVTVPAKTGETYGTQAEELILRGNAPAGAKAIYVNDYKLQLFDPAKGEWSYVASLRLRNMVPGANIYDVYAEDAAGKKSPPGRITIVQGSETTGVIAGAPASSVAGGTQSSAASSVPLPQNTPILPGSLKVLLPTPGTSHSETGTGFLLEGETSAQTASVYVNDYKLQLYRAGKTTWNYVADPLINNLKKGKNTYVIVTRNKDNQILDTLTYTVQYDPK